MNMHPKPSKARLKKNQEIREFNQRRLALITAAPDLLDTIKTIRQILRQGDGFLASEGNLEWLSQEIDKAEGK